MKKLKPAEGPYEDLVAMLTTEPILWAVVTGSQRVEHIAVRLFMKTGEVRRQLEAYEEEGVLTKLSDNRYHLNNHDDGFKALQKMNHYATRLGELLEEKSRQIKIADYPLTANQKNLLKGVKAAILENYGDPVTTKQVATALGYKHTGFTSSNLKAIEKKGAVKRSQTTPMRWSLV